MRCARVFGHEPQPDIALLELGYPAVCCDVGNSRGNGEAARLARAANRPVAVHWTRADEFTWAYFRPAAVIECKGGLDDEAFECGPIVNPAHLLSQVQGCICMGLGPALHEAIANAVFAATRVRLRSLPMQSARGRNEPATLR